MRPSRTRALLLGAVLLPLWGCDSQPVASAPAPVTPGGPRLAEITCTADARARTFTCAQAAPTGASRDVLILGGQNFYVRLRSSGTAYNGSTDVLTSNVSVQNLLAQAMGSSDGAVPDADGVRVFFAAGPTSGVTLANATGTGTFTGSDQPYFGYSGTELGGDGLLSPGEVSTAKPWQFRMNGASTFTFTAYVYAKIGSAGSPYFSLETVTAGYSHSCAVGAAGAVYCWGQNTSGQLGDGTTTNRSTPTRVSMPAGVTFARVASGVFHTCALATSGDAYCWGTNYSGQLGDGTNTDRSTPTRVSAPDGVTFTQLGVSGSKACALTAAGAAYCWGEGSDGMVGDGGTANRNVPTAVSMPAGVTFAQISAGTLNTCGLTASGAAYCWGFNSDGEVGNGTNSRSQTKPAAVSMPAGVSFATLSVGGSHTCALTASGDAYCWGFDSDGQLGDGTNTSRNTPTPVSMPAGISFAQISGGDSHTCASTTTGAAYCWGRNSSGGLGDGGTASRTTPGAVSLPAGVAVAEVAAGGNHSCGRASSGALYCWGLNQEGQLGDGTTTDRATPVPVHASVPTESPAFLSLAYITAGDSHSCAVGAAGAVYCWGQNQNGQLGDGTTTSRSTPTRVSMPAGVTFARVASGASHTCALASSGDAYCWGMNYQGQLGDGTNTTRNTPTRVSMPAGVTFTQLAVSGSNTCALTAAGAAYCWGDGSDGMIGDGGGVNRNVPTAVSMPAGVTFAQISTGTLNTCGLTASGAAYCWGFNSDGEVGNGTNSRSQTKPVAVSMPTGVSFATLTVGGSHTCALTSSGEAYCWGFNSDGQLGDGTNTSRNTPTPVTMPAGFSFAQISGGDSHTCATTTAGAAYCWGNNLDGKLGDGSATHRNTPGAVSMPAGVSVAQVAAGGTHSCGRASSGALYCWGLNHVGQLGDGTTTDHATPARVAGAR